MQRESIRTWVGSLSLSLVVLAGIALVASGGSAEEPATPSDGPPAYAIAQIAIHDREEYRSYEAGFLPIFQRHGGEMLSVDESPELLEGEWPWTRTVLLRFPSREALRGWYDSPEYRELAKHRHAASDANIVIVDGLPSR